MVTGSAAIIHRNGDEAMTLSMMSGLAESLRIDGLSHYAEQVDSAAARIAELETRLQRTIAAARELNSWDWRHLLIDHPDSDVVRRDAQALDDVLDDVDGVPSPSTAHEEKTK
jgi:hypothetical protein